MGCTVILGSRKRATPVLTERTVIELTQMLRFFSPKMGLC